MRSSRHPGNQDRIHTCINCQGIWLDKRLLVHGSIYIILSHASQIAYLSVKLMYIQFQYLKYHHNGIAGNIQNTEMCGYEFLCFQAYQ